MLKYLPVQAGQWVVGIPLAAVVEVRAFHSDDAPASTEVAADSPSRSEGVPAISLSALLGDASPHRETKYGILMGCREGVFALLIEAMELPQIAHSVDPLPLLVESPFFTSVIAQNDTPICLVNVEAIGHTIYESAVQEHTDAVH